VDLIIILVSFAGLILFIIVMISLLRAVDRHTNDDPDPARNMNAREFNLNILQEMYRIWVGRIYDLVKKTVYNYRVPITCDHYISVVIWLLTLLGLCEYLLNYSAGTETRDFWFVVVGFIFLLTLFYSRFKVMGLFSPPERKLQDPE